MVSIIRNISQIDLPDRQALEHILGRELRDNQQVLIQVTTIDDASRETAPIPASQVLALPPWCNVYAGLSDQEIDAIEEVILDRDHWNRQSH